MTHRSITAAAFQDISPYIDSLGGYPAPAASSPLAFDNEDEWGRVPSASTYQND